MSHSDTSLDRRSMPPQQDPSREGRPGSARYNILSTSDLDQRSIINPSFGRQLNSKILRRASATVSGAQESSVGQTTSRSATAPPGPKISGSHLEPPIVFCPPDINWQRKKAKLFGVTVRNSHWFVDSNSCHSFPSDCPPKTCEQVAGDGNCLFRSISFWITGSEEYHLEVREMIVQEIFDNARLYSAVTSNHSIASYLRESQMSEEGVWGSEVEIFVAATILQTPIAVFAAFGERYLWQIFKPLRYTEPREKRMLYLHNSNNHFEPVIDV